VSNSDERPDWFDPVLFAKMQSGLDGLRHAREGTPLGEALRRSVPRIRAMFGQDIPREVIEAAVTMGYCASRKAQLPEQDE
jgi:hypothetical protein